jgi:hypothetical protein
MNDDVAGDDADSQHDEKDHAGEHFMTRPYVVAELVQQGLSTRVIAEQLHVHHTTVVRDIKRARAIGALPAVAPKSPSVPKKTDGKRRVPRIDLLKSWLASTDLLNRKVRSLESMRADDRYRRRLPDLMRTRGDLLHAQRVISEVLADMDSVRQQPVDEEGTD